MPARMRRSSSREARAGPRERDRVLVHVEQRPLELAVARVQLSRDEVLRVVAPVAVRADPDLEQRRLALDDRPRRRGREGPDARARPHEREPERELDLPLPARALAVDEALPLRRDLRLGHPGLEDQAAMLHRGGRDVVREAHALDLLLGLDGARLGEKRSRVLGLGKRVEPAAREGRRLADHAVGGLRSEGELEPELPVAGRDLLRELEHARSRRPRIAGVVAAEEPHLARPGGARGVFLGRLEADQHRLALAREDARVVPLHPPEVRQVDDVVGRAHDERVEPALAHERAHALELRVVPRPGHGAILRLCRDRRLVEHRRRHVKR